MVSGLKLKGLDRNDTAFWCVRRHTPGRRGRGSSPLYAIDLAAAHRRG